MEWKPIIAIDVSQKPKSRFAWRIPPPPRGHPTILETHTKEHLSTMMFHVKGTHNPWGRGVWICPFFFIISISSPKFSHKNAYLMIPTSLIISMSIITYKQKTIMVWQGEKNCRGHSFHFWFLPRSPLEFIQKQVRFEESVQIIGPRNVKK